MRLFGGLTVVALMSIAGPAWAREGATDFAGLSPLPISTLSTAPVAVAPDLRLRVSIATLAPISTTLDLDGAVRRRFDSSMIDYYPPAAAGFHLSAGVRLFALHNFAREAEKATHGLLQSARIGGFGSASRHLTPVMMVGYDRLVSQHLSLGIEGGALVGRLTPTSRLLSGLGGRDGSRINPLVHATLGWHF